VTEVAVALLKVPQLAPAQPDPAKDHVTPLFCESLVTDAVNAAVPMPACRLELPGEIDTETTGLAVIVMAAAALFVPSEIEVAVSVTSAGFGTALGALYVAPVTVKLLSVPHVAPLQPAPERDHVTPLFCASFCTVAVKFLPPPTAADVAVGETETAIDAPPRGSGVELFGEALHPEIVNNNVTTGKKETATTHSFSNGRTIRTAALQLFYRFNGLQADGREIATS